MSRFQLAQLNVGRTKGPLDSPLMADFMANLDRINALADHSPGFVWRLQDESGNATSVAPSNDNLIVNMSVWDDVASLNHYVYKTAHVEIMKRRKEWFERMQDNHFVLWWVPRGHVPTLEEAMARLEMLRADGPTPLAFTFRHAFAEPDAPVSAPAPTFGDVCPA